MTLPTSPQSRHHRVFRLPGLLALLVLTTLPARGHAQVLFNLDTVAARAQKMAAASFEDTVPVPEWLTRIGYDQWRSIRFRPERAIWRDTGTPFQLQFFHPGYFYSRTVAIHLVDEAGVHPVPFSPNDFDYGSNDFASRVPQGLGYAGLRIHAPIKRADYFDEVIVFLGASYFRAVGRDDSFGLTARGLALDTGLASGEEFPFFREFWVVKPALWATDIVVYAILDSRSMTGAYRFIVHPGEQTSVDVEVRLFPRRDVQQLGVAPLASMFLHGENSPRVADDFRPEVHDSDGLLMHFLNGEWLWRPLANPRALQISNLRMNNPRGFGLMQRDRNFANYQDLETHRERQPSAWIRPRGEWNAGRVILVEIPSKLDSNDNVVAFWVPEKTPKAGESMTLEYTISWFGDDPERPPGGRTVSTRRDRGNRDDAHRFVVEFASPELEALPADTILHGAISVASGQDSAELLDQQVVKNSVTGTWRLTFQVRPKRSEPIELRAYLDTGGRALTETWSYLLAP